MFDNHDIIRDDCLTLLQRAFLAYQVNVFGLDGNGKYGSDYHGHKYTIKDVKVPLVFSIDTDFTAIVNLYLDGYDSTKFGHAATDKNLEISLNSLLDSADIDNDCWSWAAEFHQGTNFVALELDVKRLLEWI